MTRNIIISLISGVIGGIIAVFFFPLISGNLITNLTSSINGNNSHIVQKEIIRILNNDEAISSLTEDTSESIVLVRALSHSKVIRFGTGILLTREVIATTGNVVPSNATSVDVTIGEKKETAKIVLRDYKKNIVLISIDQVDRPIVTFSKSDNLNVGKFGYLIGEYLDNSGNALLFSQQGLLSRSINGNFLIDTKYSNDVSGTPMVEMNGNVLGLVYISKGEIILIPAEEIKTVFEGYSNSINNE